MPFVYYPRITNRQSKTMILIASKALFLIPVLSFLIVYQKFIFGFGIGVLLRDSRKTLIKLSIGETLMHSGMSLLLTLMVENIRISSTSAIFYVVGFLKLPQWGSGFSMWYHRFCLEIKQQIFNGFFYQMLREYCTNFQFTSAEN